MGTFGNIFTSADLFGLEPRRHPGVLLRGASRIVVRDGVPLEVGRQLRHHFLQLPGHGAHRMLFTHTLTVHTDLPVGEGRTQKKRIHEDMATQRVLGPCNTDLCVAQQKL